MSRGRVVLLVAVLVVIAAAVVGVKTLTSGGVTGAMPNHISVTAAKADTSGQSVKVGGDVLPGSISWNGASGSLLFTLTGQGDRMSVSYRGSAPKDFKPGSAVVVEGKYLPSEIFEATSLTTTTSPLCRACHG